MSVVGINHLTFSTADPGSSGRFYREVLGFEMVAEWPRGAYLVAGDLWLALVLGPDESRKDDDYSHIALHVDQHHFDGVAERIRAAGTAIWQDNHSEGDSLYFRDPDGHQLEIHVTSLAARLDAAMVDPWEGLAIADGARGRARARPSLSDPHKPRRLACAPVGVFVVVVDDEDRILFLTDPASRSLEVPNGAMEPGEEPAATAQRELREEGGPVEVGSMHAFAAFNVDYHPHLPPLISLGFVCRHLGGTATPGDDMAHCKVEWLHIDDVDPSRLHVPADTDILRSAIRVLGALAT